jgi:hypothetical protein
MKEQRRTRQERKRERKKKGKKEKNKWRVTMILFILYRFLKLFMI